MNWKQILYLVLFFTLPLFVSGQSDEDLTKADKKLAKGGIAADSVLLKKHSPKKAALYSLIPGGGQFYNRKYWKIPVVFAAFFVTGSYIVKNNQKFKAYKAEAINRYNFGTIVNFPDETDEDVLAYKDKYESQRNIGILVIVGLYILQIVDASVDAHFFTFDVSPDVTLRAEPYIRLPEFNTTTPINTGLTLSLNF